MKALSHEQEIQEVKTNTARAIELVAAMLLVVATVFSLAEGIDRITFNLLGASLFAFSFSGSPEILTNNNKDNRKPKFSRLSIVLFLLGWICIAASLII